MIWGGLTGEENVNVLDEGKEEMVVNSYFEDLKGRVGMKSVWEFVPKAGKKRGMKE